jgi:hypothetical protein
MCRFVIRESSFRSTTVKVAGREEEVRRRNWRCRFIGCGWWREEWVWIMCWRAMRRKSEEM